MQLNIAFFAAKCRGSWTTLIAHLLWLPFTIQCCCLSVLICSGTFSEDLLPLCTVEEATLLRNNKKYLNNRPPETKQIKRDFSRLLVTLSINLKGVVYRNIYARTKEWPPPFLGSQIGHVWWNVLIYAINIPHILIVNIYYLWLFDINFFSLFPTKSLSDCLMLFSSKDRNCVNCIVAFPPNCSNIRRCIWNKATSYFNPRWYNYNTFIHTWLIGQAIQCPDIVFKIIENPRLCQ